MNLKQTLLPLGLALWACAQPLHAAVNIYNFNINDLTEVISFDISGTIEAGSSFGDTEPQKFFIGVQGDGDWVTSSGFGGSLINNPGATRDLHTGLHRYYQYAFGDYIELTTADFNTFNIGDTIDATVSISGGDITGTNLNWQDLVVTVGYQSTGPYSSIGFPDPDLTVGTAVVPEPAQIGLVLALGMGAFVLRRRTQARR